jgi:hypothetical protein
MQRSRRGGTLLWSLGALLLALALTPLYVSLCHSLSTVTTRSAHRLVATQRGEAELERLRAGGGARTFPVPELPGGQGTVTLNPSAGGLQEAHLVLTWTESGRPGRAEWTTLIRAHGGRP